MTINSVVLILDFILLNMIPLEFTLTNIPTTPNWEDPESISLCKLSPSTLNLCRSE